MVSDATPPMARALQLSFTGSGSEYFRIWAVNLLLTIVTLGLYRPWAKVRRLRYFYGNTVLDDHAFDFHGDPLKMLRGLLLVGAMLVVYSFARRGSPMASLVALLALAALAPALMRAAFQFRLGNTSWRGLRFRFHGDLAGAYRALIPAFIPGAAFLAIGLGVTDPLHPPPWFFKASGGVTLITLVLAPLIWWGLKRYQHGHMGLGPWRTTLKLGPMPVYALGLKLIGVMLLSAFLFGVLMAVLGAKLGMALHGLSEGPRSAAATLAITFAVGALVWLLILLVPMPFAISRAQNMIWDHTECAEVSFESRLGFWPLFGLTVQNWLLMAVTLGLYWPFAAVAMYRLKVESVTPQLRGDLDHLRDPRQAAVTDASGDFAGDLFGIDIGL
ncbi:MAG: DUF898 domain-containing protein [Burkholderiaceae bacterium]|nr:DUF898 domain-containing protein [Roseateles sp.]MBV8469048.1 DUF898 domain-containing protein [Burkholderiaceae bacterium]